MIISSHARQLSCSIVFFTEEDEDVVEGETKVTGKRSAQDRRDGVEEDEEEKEEGEPALKRGASANTVLLSRAGRVLLLSRLTHWCELQVGRGMHPNQQEATNIGGT